MIIEQKISTFSSNGLTPCAAKKLVTSNFSSKCYFDVTSNDNTFLSVNNEKANEAK